MSLTKDKIISDIYNNVGLSKGQSRSVVEKLFEICKETLERGEDLLVSGLVPPIVCRKLKQKFGY